MASEIVPIIIEILKQSKEDNIVSDSSSLNEDMMNQLGFPKIPPFSVDRIQRIDLAMVAVTNGAGFATIVELLTSLRGLSQESYLKTALDVLRVLGGEAILRCTGWRLMSLVLEGRQ
ncbi:MAG: hypothetical protein ACXAAO_14500 [Candidatus Thorarchaeota archaeon]